MVLVHSLPVIHNYGAFYITSWNSLLSNLQVGPRVLDVCSLVQLIVLCASFFFKCPDRLNPLQIYTGMVIEHNNLEKLLLEVI